MRKIKVAIVDDSAFMRKVISDILEKNEGLEVVAKFRNGKELIEKVDQYEPDIITLDIEMPILNGLETLKELKKQKKDYPIIMLSSLTTQNSIHTIECLSLGATDFIEKPTNAMALGKEFKYVLIEKILAIAKRKKNIVDLELSIDRFPKRNKEVTVEGKVDVVVIGASTGGPKALQAVLTKIDGDINVPIFVVQHMPKGFTKAFADRLNGLCKLKTVEAEDGMHVERNTIYIAPGGHHMTVIDRKIKLNDEPAIWGVRPAVDKLFESAVKVYRKNILSVILTGMGRDGAKGTEVIKDAGGITISEDESTCTIYGMPKAAYETGKVDLVLPLNEIPAKINSIIKGR
ncbi:MAG: chemotaxis response regulator protein-glutamate methylesterase [Clostridiaceae bacterium]|nr:chemotaxis response regulator protein-glutamate methylesterase [Clostridiaceae bacterium]